jgi:hypothetical protein
MEPPPYLLPDARHLSVLETLLSRVSNRLTLVVNQLSDFRKEIVQFSRFINHPKITPLEIMYTATKHLEVNCKNRHILLIQDTTEASFGYAPFQKGLSPVGSGIESGFHLHPVITVEARTNLLIGLASVEIFQREEYSLDNPNHDAKVRHAVKHRLISGCKNYAISKCTRKYRDLNLNCF